jgi:uncharacterized protein (DUF362 family)
MAEMTTKVALVRSNNRRGAVAAALHLVADDLRKVVRPQTLLKPNFVSHTRQLPSTHPDALSATIDALLAAGAQHITIAEGASDAAAAFKNFGHAAESDNRFCTFFDINKDETDWHEFILTSVNGESLPARISRTIAEADCRVSLALMKTHVTPMLTMSLKNMLSSVHPHDRIRMHGFVGGNGVTGWKKPILEFMKGDKLLVNSLTKLQGHVRNAINFVTRKSGNNGWNHLSKADLAYLKSVAAMCRNLVSLNQIVKPHVSILDGFIAMHREGPRHGTPIKLGVAIAGTDAVAVDAVGAAVMGFDPMQIGYLRLAHEVGLGIADLSQIEIVGEPIAKVSRKCVPHSNFAVQRYWDRIDLGNKSAVPAPHVALKKLAESRTASK